MKVYTTNKGIVIQDGSNYFLTNQSDWDTFINDDRLSAKIRMEITKLQPDRQAFEYVSSELLPPIKKQEIWACGVTYYRSKVGRQEESKETGGSEFYSRVYEAERPEIFFKSIGKNNRVYNRKRYEFA